MSRWQLHHGEALAVLTTLEAGTVDAVITDPPYSSGGLHKGARMQKTNTKYTINRGQAMRPEFLGDNRDQRSFLAWCTLWLSECLRVSKEGAPICVFTDWRQLPTITDAVQGAGWTWLGVVPWDKGAGTRPRLGGFRAQAEYIVWGSKGQLPSRPEVGALPGVLRHTVKQADKHHIAGKPTPLMRDLVKVCPPGGTVLDPFAGSGTTLVAALQEGFGAIGVEMTSEYFEIAQRRCEEVAGERIGPLFEREGAL